VVYTARAQETELSQRLHKFLHLVCFRLRNERDTFDDGLMPDDCRHDSRICVNFD
jgi:hypothetical protein